VDSASQKVHSILGFRRRFFGLASQLDDTSLLAICRLEQNEISS
jgi:hypothetical protein